MGIDNDFVESLPTGYRINNVAHYCQDTKPTGSAIAIGDRWYKPVDGSDWYWSGSDWLSSETYTIKSDYKENSYSASGNISGGFLSGRAISTGRGGLFFLTASAAFYSGGATTATDYWRFDFQCVYGDGSLEVLATVLGTNKPANTWNRIELAINSKKNSSGKTFFLSYVSAYKIGVPQSIFAMTELEYKHVHP